MNKYAEVLASQNPTMEHKCENCNHKNKIKTKELLSAKKDYVYTCPKCGAETAFKNVPAFIKDFEKQMKKAGIQVK